MPHDDLDAEKLAVLRRWGVGLQTDPRGEVAAAGRAITLLIDEIERLHVLVWDRRLYPEAPAPAEPAGSEQDAKPEHEVESHPQTRLAGLRRRIQRRRPEDSPQPHPQAASAPEAGFPDGLQQAAEPHTGDAVDASETF